MEIGVGGLILVIWVAAVLFGGPDTRAMAWTLAGGAAILAVVAVIALLILFRG